MLKFSLILLIFTSLSSFAITPSPYDVGAPYANTESFVFPASANCVAKRKLNETSQHYFENIQIWGGTLNIYDGRVVECTVPFKYDRYIRSIVFRAVGGVPALRSCTMGPMYSGGGRVSSVNMPLVSWNNQDWFRHDDLGLVPFYETPLIPKQLSMLSIICLTGSAQSPNHTKFSNIRIDYDL